jgi:Tfp pilus assembly protein PilF
LPVLPGLVIRQPDGEGSVTQRDGEARIRPARDGRALASSVQRGYGADMWIFRRRPAARSDILPAEEAFARLDANPASIWPARQSGRALYSGFASPSFRPGFAIASSTKVFAIGSCFAREIEKRMAAMGMPVLSAGFSLPEGERRTPADDQALNKYTPLSMLTEVRLAARHRSGRLCERDLAACLIEVDGGWIDGQIHAGPGPVPRDRALARRRQVVELFSRAFDADVLVLTLGLIESWTDRRSGLHLNQPPSRKMVQRHPGRFALHPLRPEECVAATRDLIACVRSFNKGCRVVLTTSPVPMLRTFLDMDVVCANAVSKATLRLACHQIATSEPAVDYYPSYETVMYSDPAKTWQDDLIHVQGQAVAHVVGRMLERYMDPTGGDPVVALATAEAALAAGDHARARSVLEPLLAQAAGMDLEWRFRVHERLATALLRGGQHRLALDHLESALAIQPRQSGILVMMGDAHAHLGAGSAADQAWRRALAVEPGCVQALIRLSNRLLGQGEPIAAADLVAPHAGPGCTSAPLLEQWSKVAWATGRQDEAVTALTGALAIPPQSLERSERLGALALEWADVRALRAVHDHLVARRNLTPSARVLVDRLRAGLAG